MQRKGVLEAQPLLPELGSGIEGLVRVRLERVLEAQLLVPELGSGARV